MTDPHWFTLESAKADLRNRVMAGEAVECPCCTQLAKVYRRRINAGAARGLIILYRLHGQDYAHVPSIGQLSRLGGEFARLAYWGLVEEATEKREDGGRAGWWRITDHGRMFLMRRITVPKYALIYDGRRLGYDGEQVSITDALGHKFDYAELMAA